MRGLPGNITQLVKNSVLQVLVQAVIDMVSILYDVFYHNIDHMVRQRAAHPLCCLLTHALCLQYVWATRRDAAYLRYLAVHFTVHGAVPHLGAAGSFFRQLC